MEGYPQPCLAPGFENDPYSMGAKLCDEDGIVRRPPFHSGTDYPCTGHAHAFGEHIRCTSPAHRARKTEVASVDYDEGRDLYTFVASGVFAREFQGKWSEPVRFTFQVDGRGRMQLVFKAECVGQAKGDVA